MRKRNLNFNPTDKIFVRLFRAQNSYFEFMTTNISCLSELMMEVRLHIKPQHVGLAQLYIRNLSAGWGCQRPLLLQIPRINAENYISRTDIYGQTASAPQTSRAPKRSHMTFPWEVH